MPPQPTTSCCCVGDRPIQMESPHYEIRYWLPAIQEDPRISSSSCAATTPHHLPPTTYRSFFLLVVTSPAFFMNRKPVNLILDKRQHFWNCQQYFWRATGLLSWVLCQSNFQPPLWDTPLHTNSNNKSLRGPVKRISHGGRYKFLPKHKT